MRTDSTISFLPESPSDPATPIGIARMAAESESSTVRNEVDYRWIQCRSTLNRVNGTRVFFEWSINPYRGCEFGCAYCYARYTHEYMNHEDPKDFERIIYLKNHAAELLKRELSRGKCADGEMIAIGGATDPYQPAEKKYKITRSILETLSLFSGYVISVTSKSDLITRDIDILKKISERHDFSVNTTITTTDAKLARILEPRAPTPRRRFETIKKLNDGGIAAGLIVAPIMPGINDSDENLESLVSQAAEANAAFVIWQPLFLASATRKRFEPFLKEEFPQLEKRYRQYYTGSIDAPHFYRAEIKKKMLALLEKYNIKRPPEKADRRPKLTPTGPTQEDLFSM